MKILRLIATPVILLALLGVLIWGALWGWKELSAPFPSPSPTPCISKTVKSVAPKNVRINVLNGGFTSGLANREASRLKTAGFDVIRVTNTDEAIRGTIIRGNQNQNPELMKMVASYFKSAAVENDNRVTGSIDVLLGTDFQGSGSKPIKKITVASGTICVPAPSASPSPKA